MNYSDFCNSIEQKNKPQNLHPSLEALWLTAAGNWDEAHLIVQSREDNDSEWIHAHLHREEGDKWNATYWYTRCGREFPSLSLKDEWEEITKDLILKYT
jgi:hypothetical protein